MRANELRALSRKADVVIENRDWRRADLRGKMLRNATVRDVCLTNARISTCEFLSCLFVNCDFSGAVIETGRFNAICFLDCTFRGAKIFDSRFHGCKFERVTFTGTSFTGSDFGFSDFVQTTILPPFDIDRDRPVFVLPSNFYKIPMKKGVHFYDRNFVYSYDPRRLSQPGFRIVQRREVVQELPDLDKPAKLMVATIPSDAGVCVPYGSRGDAWATAINVPDPLIALAMEVELEEQARKMGA